MELFLASLGDLVGILCEVGRKMREAGAKMAASRAPDGPYWRLDGHLGVNLGGFGTILSLTWWILGWSWEVLRRILETFWYMGGITRTYGFLKVFDAFGVFRGS